jgi:hypothetical protein
MMLSYRNGYALADRFPLAAAAVAALQVGPRLINGGLLFATLDDVGFAAACTERDREGDRMPRRSSHIFVIALRTISHRCHKMSVFAGLTGSTEKAFLPTPARSPTNNFEKTEKPCRH